MKPCKISVLTPSYNQGKYLRENILSVLDQAYPFFEHIIMDGGSTDETLDILQSYPHLIWRSEKDRGQAHALNKALLRTSGDIVCWLNADDMLCRDAFNTVIAFMTTHPDVDIVTGHLDVIDAEGTFLRRLQSETITYEGLLNGGQCVLQPSTFFRRYIFDEIGHFNETYHYCMDHEFFLRAASRFQWANLPIPLARFRVHSHSKTTTAASAFIREISDIRERYGGRLLSYWTFAILYARIAEPFKRITWLRDFFRKLRHWERKW